MDTASAEARHLAGGVEPCQWRAVGAEHLAVEVGLDAAQGLSGQDIEADSDERAVRRVQDPVRCGDPCQSVAA